MKKQISFLVKCFHALPVLLLAVFFVFKISLANTSELIITEIMYDPKDSDTGKEWFEIYNASESKISVPKSFLGLIDEIEERDETGKLKNTCHTFDRDLVLDPGSYAVIADNSVSFLKDYGDYKGSLLDSSFSLLNAQDTIKISFDRCKTWATEITYDAKLGASGNGKTLELDKDGWRESFNEGGTPGIDNSKKQAPLIYSDKIILNEILPNPDGDDKKGEYIELFNASDTVQDLFEWRLVDLKGKGFLFSKEYCREHICSIRPNEYFVIYSSSYYPRISLRNSSERIALVDPNGSEVSFVEYDKCKTGSYNFNGSVWKWSSLLTPGEENMFEDVPVGTVEIDKNIYTHVYAEFSVAGLTKGSKVVWNFGDGHKSYLAKTRHKYSEKGKYAGSVTFKKGSQEVLQTFSIDVEEYPKKNVRIISINANPKGKDSEFETITFENKSKKKVNLKGWSIATGWKKLINHPINEDFEIAAGKIRELTRISSKFSLNNKQVKIELRYPNGEVASKVKYKLEKSIAEGAKFVREGKEWRWQNAEQNPNDKIQISNKIQNQNSINIVAENSGQMVILNQETQSRIERQNKLKKLEILPIEEQVRIENEVREENGQYYFTEQANENEHYAIVFIKNTSANLNTEISNILNNFFN